jgi:O-antigen/teichoic acid export membrane protein
MVRKFLKDKFRSVNLHLRGATGKNILLVYSTDILSKLFSVVVTVLTIRVLNTTDYGLYTLIVGISTFAAAFVGDGLNLSLIRVLAGKPVSEDGDRIDAIVTSNFLFQIAQFALLFIILGVFAKSVSLFLLSNAEFWPWVFVGLLSSFGIILIQFNMSLARAAEKFKLYGTVNYMRILLILAAYLVLLLFKKLNLANIAILMSVIPALLGIYLISKDGFLNNFLEKVKVMQSLHYLRGEFFLLAFFSISAIFSQVNIFVVAKFKGVNELATYGVAQKYYLMIILLLSSVSTVLFPKVAKMMNDTLALRHFMRKWIRISIMSALPFAALIIVAPVIMNFLNGYKYPGANFIFQILCISAFFSLIFSPLTSILISLKEYRFLALSGVILQTMNLLIGIAVITNYGIIGLVVVFTLFNVLGHLWSFSKIIRCLEIN